jgi:hypothetical protein
MRRNCLVQRVAPRPSNPSSRHLRCEPRLTLLRPRHCPSSRLRRQVQCTPVRSCATTRGSAKFRCRSIGSTTSTGPGRATCPRITPVCGPTIIRNCGHCPNAMHGTHGSIITTCVNTQKLAIVMSCAYARKYLSVVGTHVGLFFGGGVFTPPASSRAHAMTQAVYSGAARRERILPAHGVATCGWPCSQ